MTKRRKRDLDRQVDAEVTKLLDRARSAEGPSEPRKHHVIPASYLSRWASERGQVRVTEVSNRHSYTSSPDKAARLTDFYRIESPDLADGEVPPLFFETLLGEVEGNTVPAIDHLVEHGFEGLSPVHVEWLTMFMAFQMTRGQGFRQQLNAIARDMNVLEFSLMSDTQFADMIERSGQEVTEEALEALRQIPDELRSGTMIIEPQQAAHIGLAGELAKHTAEFLQQRDWRLFLSPTPLLTCDEPVLVLGGAACSRRLRTGLELAGAILFPLDPFHLLVLFHPVVKLDFVGAWFELGYDEVAEINREIAASANRWIFSRESSTEARTIPLPPPQPMLARSGPYPVVGEPNSAIYHTVYPSRWWTAPNPPPWPVQRWWRGALTTRALDPFRYLPEDLETALPDDPEPR